MEFTRSCLFINDDPLEQALFDSVLNAVSADITCYKATDDIDRLWLIQNESIFPDYIFIELETTCINGVWFLRQLKQINYLKDIPVIVHALEPIPDRIDELKREGAFAIHFGPYSIGDFTIFSVSIFMMNALKSA